MARQASESQPKVAVRVGSRNVVSWLNNLVFGGNVYTRTELAGAFGDLGTFVPFVTAYITLNKMDPLGVLLGFGIFKVIVGLVYKTPVPVQPMKVIGGAAIANPGAISPNMIWGSGIFTAVAWTVMGLTGTVDWLHKLATKPVIRGIMLGLGMSFGVEGLKMMVPDPILAVIAVVLTLLLLASQRFPAMLMLLVLGIAFALVREPSLLGELGRVSLHLRLPSFALGQLTWNDIVFGTVVLGIAQVPLTLGNAIIGTVAENNELFPDRPLTVKKLALSTGIMNFVSTAIGGVPLCHGAGGMAGHVRFGARTGGALVMLGLIVMFLALFLSDSVTVLFTLMPNAVLGVILIFTGLELASIVRDIGSKREDIYVMLLTATVATFNIGIAFVAGVILQLAVRRRIVKL